MKIITRGAPTPRVLAHAEGYKPRAYRPYRRAGSEAARRSLSKKGGHGPADGVAVLPALTPGAS
jgi:hypothetical protein